MMDESKLNRTAYVGDQEDGSSKYLFFLDDREVIAIYANKDEPNLPIYVGTPHGEDRIKTSFAAQLVEDGSRISAMSIKLVAYVAAPWLIAAVYVPQND